MSRNMRVVNRGAGATPLTGAARPAVAEPTPEDFTPISAETFGYTELSVAVEAFDYDPFDYTSDEVKQYVEENPERAEAIMELELNGKARSGLLSFLDNFNEPEG